MARWLMSVDVLGWQLGKIDDPTDPLLELPELVADFEKGKREARLRRRRWITERLSRIIYDPETRRVDLLCRWDSGVKLASPRGLESDPNAILRFESFAGVLAAHAPRRLPNQPIAGAQRI